MNGKIINIVLLTIVLSVACYFILQNVCARVSNLSPRSESRIGDRWIALKQPRLFGSVLEPFEWGFLNANVTCREGDKRKRIKVVSDVFRWCPFDKGKRKAYVEDQADQVKRTAKTICAGEVEVTNYFLESYSSRESADKAWKREMHNADYSEHKSFSFESSYYASKCK
jgi:hypothetical protein